MKFEQQQIEIDELINQRNFDVAKNILVECLNEEPNNLAAYHRLGSLYEKLNEAVSARECYLGRLPENVQQVDFSFDPSQAVDVSSDVSNFVAHASSVQPCISDSVINHPTTRAYKDKELCSKSTGLHIAANARLWYDGLNTVLFDKNNQIVKSASSVNIAPVFNATKHHAVTRYPGKIVLIGAQGSNNYYHWMADVLPKFEILRLCNIELPSNTRFVFTNVTQKFQTETLRMLGIKQEQIIQTWEQGSYLQADEVIVPYLNNDMGLSMGGWLPQYLKQTFLKTMDAKTPPKILLSRDPENSHGRGIGNVKEFNQFYIDQGYELFIPDRYSVKEQIEIFAGADAIVGVHGAGLANLLFCKLGASVLELFGPHFAPCYWAISELNQLHYRNINCVVKQPDKITTDSQVEQAKSLGARRSTSFSVPMAAL